MTPVDVSRLDVNVTERPHCRRVLDMVIPLDIVEAERKAARRKFASGVRVKGFRKGRVPAHVMAEYGADMEEEALQTLVRESVEAALKDNGLEPYSKVAVENVRFRPGEPLSFRAAFDVRPEILVKRVDGFRRESLPGREPDEEEVDLRMEELRRNQVSWRPVDKGNPKAGDAATIVISRAGDESAVAEGVPSGHGKPGGFGELVGGGELGDGEAGGGGEAGGEADAGGPDGQPDADAGSDADTGMRAYRFVLGRAQALPGIEKAVASMEPGSEGVFDVAFPGSSNSEPGEVRAMRIRLIERHEPELPELNDDFAASLGDFDSVQALRDDVRSQLDRLYQVARRRQEDADLVQQVIEANNVQAPRSMVEGVLEKRVADLEPANEEHAAQLRAELWDDAEAATKYFLLTKAIVEQFGLAPTEEELDQEIEALAKHMDDTPSRIYAALQKSGEIRDIVGTLEERKVIEFLRDRSPISEE